MSSLLNILRLLLHLLITYSLSSILGRVWSAHWCGGTQVILCFTLQQTIQGMNTCYDITDNWQLYLITAECHWSLVGFLLQSKIHLKVVIMCLFRTLIVYVRKWRK